MLLHASVSGGRAHLICAVISPHEREANAGLCLKGAEELIDQHEQQSSRAKIQEVRIISKNDNSYVEVRDVLNKIKVIEKNVMFNP